MEGDMRLALFDYGAGNMHSLAKALARAGADVRVETEAERCLNAEGLVLPGVGAFAHAANRLTSSRAAVRDAIEQGFPTLGICLGMQLLFDTSDEGAGEGLGVIRGRVTRLNARRVPQIGWNTVCNTGEALLDRSLLSYVYYANSYRVKPIDDSCVSAWTTYEDERFPAIVRYKRAMGVQFHPEKGSSDGIAFLAAIVREMER
jgi:glutamine amidotransferase